MSNTQLTLSDMMRIIQKLMADEKLPLDAPVYAENYPEGSYPVTDVYYDTTLGLILSDVNANK